MGFSALCINAPDTLSPHCFVGEQFVGIRSEYDPACLQHVTAVGYTQCGIGILLHQQHGYPAVVLAL